MHLTICVGFGDSSMIGFRGVFLETFSTKDSDETWFSYLFLVKNL